MVIEALLVRDAQHFTPSFPPSSGQGLERFGPTINPREVEELDPVGSAAFWAGSAFAAPHETGSGHWTAK